jgi:hypothetical protein
MSEIANFFSMHPSSPHKPLFSPLHSHLPPSPFLMPGAPGHDCATTGWTPGGPCWLSPYWYWQLWGPGRSRSLPLTTPALQPHSFLLSLSSSYSVCTSSQSFLHSLVPPTIYATPFFPSFTLFLLLRMPSLSFLLQLMVSYYVSFVSFRPTFSLSYLTSFSYVSFSLFYLLLLRFPQT